MPGSKGFNSKDEKFQPAKLSDREREGQRNESTSGYLHKFNYDHKVTNVKGSAYQDFGGGISDNFGEKDDNMSALERRLEKGQMVQRWNATHRDSVEYRDGGGLTAYNSAPIPETFTPATSNGAPDANAVEYNTKKKNRD